MEHPVLISSMEASDWETSTVMMCRYNLTSELFRRMVSLLFWRIQIFCVYLQQKFFLSLCLRVLFIICRFSPIVGVLECSPHCNQEITVLQSPEYESTFIHIQLGGGSSSVNNWYGLLLNLKYCTLIQSSASVGIQFNVPTTIILRRKAVEFYQLKKVEYIYFIHNLMY